MTATTTNRPSHRLFNVTGDGDKSRWTDIGAAWPTKDGKGFTIALNALPAKGRVIMWVNTPKEAKSPKARKGA